MKKTALFFLIATSVAITSATIDLDNLFNYAGQTKPNYIVKDNTPQANPITNAGATLGRVLFYDKNLSANNTIACGSCHKQQFAFGDTAALSVGLDGGLTGRHSMRLVNARFGAEQKFFWNERATSLEDQTTRPIQDHVEMGFSGTSGDPDMDSLIRKLQNISYYPRLFTLVYGSDEITETKIQNALAQFVRSIQSFDSKFDVGRAQALNDGTPFINFTQEENQGKQLFLTPPPNGAGCQGCHAAPEFDIDPNTQNNGVIQVAADTTQIDLLNTRAPSLRDLVNPNGEPNGPMMHNGRFTTLLSVINHYNSVPAPVANTNLDPRLQGPGSNLQLNQTQKDALIAFLKTLTGTAVYTAEQWSDPFDAQGNIDILPLITSIQSKQTEQAISIYPNPASEKVTINLPDGNYRLTVFDINGKLLSSKIISDTHAEPLSNYQQGILLFQFKHLSGNETFVKRIVKQ